jgi:phage tail-like protein
MKLPVEFRRQTFRTADHWAHGLGYTLQPLEGGGVALFSRPGFGGWVVRDPAAFDAQSLAMDDCGRLFWIGRRDCQLYRRDPANSLVEPVVELADCEGGARHAFGRLLYGAGRLWLVDVTLSRLAAIRPDTFQVITDIPLRGPLDAAVGAGRLFALDLDGIHAFDLTGGRTGGPYSDQLSDPIALGADPHGRWIYAIDRTRSGFLRFSAETGAFDSEIGSFPQAGVIPHLFVVHPDGNLFVSDGSPVAHEFAADGGYIGGTGDVSPLTAIQGMAVTNEGDLMIGSPSGIARFTREAGIAGNKGQFYTRTLDNGLDREGWQRLDLVGELEAGGALDISYASSDNAGLASAVDGIFDRAGAAADKVAALELVLGGEWVGPEQLRTGAATRGASPANAASFAGSISHSVLLAKAVHRYLWIKLELSGLALRARATVRELRLYYPRLSYLRYLPAVYQSDPVSQEFLGRFLSMFETVVSGIDATIERIPQAFDPALTPREFLDWLGQWLDLGIEEDWPPAVKRRLISNATRLYQQKGTPAGLASFIEIVTGTRPIIREAFEAERPFVLGDGTFLGTGTRLFARATADVRRDQRTVLGCASVLGTTEVRSTTRVPADPFRASAHRVTVLLNMTRAHFQRHERGLRRIIRENAPAHVSYDIRLTSGAGLGADAMVGVTLAVANPQPLRLGSSTLGRAICVRGRWYGPELGVDARLDGPADESTGARALPDGER